LPKIVLALVVALVALTGVAVPPQGARAAAPTDPKVVIVVGATHSATARDRSYADEVYAEAIKYSGNVVRLYSPNATWSKVKAALQGASIVVYMGHGNGFPSPYATSPRPLTQNGFGLNDAAKGLSDNNNTYYGESYIDDVDLAPNAVVLLHHLCYASGNSEPGKAAPTLAVAKARVDNYASGFIRAGAAAVIADGHSHNAHYIRSLFTTHQTIDQIWRSAPNFHNHVISFASSRSSGRTAQMDPDTSTSGYYRSVVGRLATRTDDITGARYAATDSDPGRYVAPGAASVNPAGVQLYADAALTAPTATLAADTRLRVLNLAGTAPDGSSIVEVATFDGSVSGFASGAQLTPRDSAGPDIWTVDDGDGAFSPNGDGSSDAYVLTARLSEESTWRVVFTSADGTVLRTRDGIGDRIDTSWSGRFNDAPVADGTYTYTITACDEWGNPEGTKSGTFTVDTIAPALDGISLTVPEPITFSPNGDGAGDQASVAYSTTEAGYVDVTVTDGSGDTVREFAASAPAGAGRVEWDGSTDASTTAPNGVYTETVEPRDHAANVGSRMAATVADYSSLKSVKAAPAVFYPHDADKYAKWTKLSFALTSAATVGWTVQDAQGNVVRTLKVGAALPAGTYAYNWNGRNDAGTLVPRGTYYSVVSATDGTLSMTSRAWTVADGFRVTASDTTPNRGQSITITATTAEKLSRTPRVIVYQPGQKAWSVSLRKITTTTYRVTLRLKSGGAGTVRFKVVGTDLGGRSNWSNLVLPLG
jgi:flagellar hook assembly protein FlgD